MNIGLKKWAVIVNPNSGKGSVKKDWVYIQQLFKTLNINAVFAFSNTPDNARALAKDYTTEGYRNIAVVGGDGTLNEVLNGILQSKKAQPEDTTIAIIPNGTGNDWARYWNISSEYEQSIALLKNGETITTDIGLCSYHKDGLSINKYFINTAGMGFEIKVLQNSNIVRTMWKGKSWMYSFSLLISTITSFSHKMTICANGLCNELKVFTLNIGNGKFSGGGLVQTPLASPTDGAFDITIIKKLSPRTLFLGIKYLFKGNLLMHPCVKAIRTNAFHVSSAKKSAIELDGIVIKAECPIDFRIIPRKIKMVIPKKSSI